MLTFHRMIAGCEAGNAAAWRGFVADYTQIFLTLTRIYLPGAADPEQLWKDALTALADNDSSVLRGFEHQSEREFLAGLRAHYLERNASALEVDRDSKDEPELTPDSLTAILKGLPLIHQEVVFLKLAGYSDPTLEKIFRITPSVAKSSVERLTPEYASALGRKRNEAWRPAAWMKLLGELWSGKTDACPALRLLIRIQDGQIGWQEKDSAEKRVSACAHCLERWTALKELGYWREAAPLATAPQVERLMAALPVRAQGANAKPFWRRLLG